MELSVVLVHYRDQERLLKLLQQLAELKHERQTEIIVVDNASGETTLEQHIREIVPNVQYLANKKNLGFGAGVNQGARLATGRVLTILNPDTELRPNFFEPLLAALAQPGVGVVGPQVWQPNGRLQLTAHKRFPNWLTVFVEYCLPKQVFLSRWLSVWHPHDESVAKHQQSHFTHHLTGVCLVTDRQRFLELGGFDERYFLYMEETDWQQRLVNSGQRAWFCAESSLVHHGSINKGFSQGNKHFLRSLDAYWRRWYGSTIGLHLTVFIATLISVAALAVGWVVSVARPGMRSKLWQFTTAYGRILWWSVMGRAL